MRFGIIGTGFISTWIINNAKHIDDFEVHAILSRSKERGQTFADEYNIPIVYTNISELANDDTIDAVYIASPNSLHKTQTISMLNAGKDVLCEKPIASNLEELNEMIACAKQNGRVFLEAMRSSFNPSLQKLK